MPERCEDLRWFFLPAGELPSASAAVLHITAYSVPSPYVSCTASYEVAESYALLGPAGRATQAVPGAVYQIDTAQIPPHDVHDPLVLISRGQPVRQNALARASYHHDGGQDLVLAIAAPSLFPGVLARPPKGPGGASNPFPPAISAELKALVFALRDAEVLLERVPPTCITNRWSVWRPRRRRWGPFRS